MKNIFKFVISIAVCELAGIIGSIYTMPAISTWYASLDKASFNPPSWVFGPVWTMLFFLMGISLFLVWRKRWSVSISEQEAGQKTWNPISSKLWIGSWREENVIIVFALQLVLNILWSVIFFGLKMPGLAFFELIMLWFAIEYMVINFYRISKVAGLLQIPYLLWVSFAGILNFFVWILNM